MRPSTRADGPVPRREFFRWAGLAALGAGLPGCAAMLADARRRYGWDAFAALGPGPYRVQIWEPIGAHTTPIFVVVLLAGDARGSIVEPYGVTDRGDVPDAGGIARELRERYPTLRPGDVEVEPLEVAGATIGYVVTTRNIRVYTDFDRSAGRYSIRLSGLGKWPRRGGGGPGAAGGR